MKAHLDWMDARRDASAQQLVDDYITANSKWITPEAEELLASLELDLLWRVIDYGSLQFCRDPVAIIRKRMNDSRRDKAWSASCASGVCSCCHVDVLSY